MCVGTYLQKLLNNKSIAFIETIKTDPAFDFLPHKLSILSIKCKLIFQSISSK